MKYLLLILLLLVGCSPPRDSHGKPWKTNQVWKRMTARKDSCKKVKL